MQLPIKSHRGGLNVSRTTFLLSLTSNSCMGNIITIVFNILHHHNNRLYKQAELCPKGVENSFWRTAGSSGAVQTPVQALLRAS